MGIERYQIYGKKTYSIFSSGNPASPKFNQLTRSSFHEEKAENALLRRALDVAEAEVAEAAEAEAEVGGTGPVARDFFCETQVDNRKCGDGQYDDYWLSQISEIYA